MKVSNNKSNRYLLLVILIYIGVLWSWLQYNVISIFTYWDEIYALTCLPLLLLYYQSHKCGAKNCKIVVCLAIFCVSGIVGDIFTEYSTFFGVASDLLLNLKFFMAIFSTEVIFKEQDIIDYRPKLQKHLDILTFIFIFLFFIDRLFHIFPVYEMRFGITSEQLIFPHPTFCAAAIFYLLMLRFMFCGVKRRIDRLYVCFLFWMIVMTLRFKAIATVIFCIALYMFVYRRNFNKLKWIFIGAALVSVLLIAYHQIAFYYSGFGLNNFPRGALLTTGIKIVRDYFPFGTGFATFGSYMSGVYYSQVYNKYGISSISGISQEDISGVTDQYWPMIMGQTGVIGLISMILSWYWLFRKIKKQRYKSNNYYMIGLSCFVYIVLSSTSESAICNPACFPIAVLLGIIFSQKTISKECKNHESQSYSIISTAVSSNS